MEKVKKIDIHAHATAFPQYHPKVVQDFVCAEDVIEVYDKLGVEKGILLPLTSAEGMVTPFPTEACIYIYATNILTDLTGSVMLTLVHETIHPNRIYQHS